MWVDRDFNPVTRPLPPDLRPDAGAGLTGRDPTAGADPPLLVLPAQIALWQGARERGDTGFAAAAGHVALALYEIPAVPDFSAARFPDLANLEARERAAAVAEQQARLLTALHTLGPAFGFSLRYLAERAAAPGGGNGRGEVRLRCFLVGRCFADTPEGAAAGAHAFSDALGRNLPAGYPLRALDPNDPALLSGALQPALSSVAAYAELVKTEQALPAWHDPAFCGFAYWYRLFPFAPNGANDMIHFCRALTAASAAEGRVLVDITLVPTPPLTPAEREELATWGTLAERWGRDQRITLPGGLSSKAQAAEVAADPQAKAAGDAYRDLLTRYGDPQGRAFLYAVRALVLAGPGEQRADADPRAVLAALAAQALAPGAGHQFLAAAPGHPAFERAVRSVHFGYVTAAVCNGALWQRDDAPETLRRLHRLAGVAEVGSLFRLPIPGKDGCPGLALDAGLPAPAGRAPGGGAPATVAGLRLGHFADGSRVTAEAATVRVADLAKHCLIVGTPGSGKTSLSFSLLVQLWREHRIPFLVLEPAKTEYRALLDVPGLGEDLLAFTVGNERVAPLRLNPFEILPGVPVSEHIAALTACFQGAFSLPDPLPHLLDEALREVYAARGWSEYDAGGDDPDLEPPTLADLHRTALAVAARSRYQGEVAGNIRAALETRLGGLLRGPKGRCFGARRAIPLSLLLTRPVVLELEPLTDEERALVMMLLLVFVREHARSTRKSGSPLAHVTLVEEAHNLVGNEAAKGGGGGSGGGDPKAVAVRYFTRMLAEMRALGEGIVIADQLPTALAAEAVKNTNVKVMHRLTAKDDREVLGGTMVLTEGQIEQAATLPPGASFVFQEGWPRARLIQEPDVKADLGLAVPPDDAALAGRMAPFPASDPAVTEAYLPYVDCAAVCKDRCDGRLRERAERWAMTKLPLIEAAVQPTRSRWSSTGTAWRSRNWRGGTSRQR